jgi:hypothetical protein
MQKTILFFTALFFSFATAQGQANLTLKKVMELKMPKTVDDDMPGTRGASVVWHPLQKKYYAAFAGNTEYPLAVFSAIGKRLSTDAQTTLVDLRGLWYNPEKKQICGNGYNDNGWVSYNLTKMGLIDSLTINFAGMNQPGEQCAGAYNTVKKQVLFLNGSQIWAYNAKAVIADSTAVIHWGLTAKDGIVEDEDVTTVPEGYNTNIIYSGIAGAEVGVLNIVDKQIELYNYKTGFISKKLKLPETAIVEPSFNFAYANGIYWLFDMEKRVWIGYK